ncbi:MAG: winged helix-turn-helix domain-containing protein [Candidatus Paceibacterota bacterium]
MEHILFLNVSYPLEPLCRALRAGGVVSTVTESTQEWVHLSRIRPWSLCVIAVEAVDELPDPTYIPDRIALLVLAEDIVPASLRAPFCACWIGGASASQVLRVARQRSLMVAESAHEISIGNLVLNSDEHSVWWKGEELLLTPRQFCVLRLLASQPGRIFTRIEIWEHCWGLSDYPESNAVDAHIRRIRRRVPRDLAACIHTAYGIGYRFLPYSGGKLREEDPILVHDFPQSSGKVLAAL